MGEPLPDPVPPSPPEPDPDPPGPDDPPITDPPIPPWPPDPPPECPDVPLWDYFHGVVDTDTNECEDPGIATHCQRHYGWACFPTGETGCPECPIAVYEYTHGQCEWFPAESKIVFDCWARFTGCIGDYGQPCPEPDYTAFEAFVLAKYYGLAPLSEGKYEPDRRQGEELRSMILANWKDATNVLIQYRPDELV